MPHDKELQMIDGPVRMHTFRHQQLLSPRCLLQQFFQHHGDPFVLNRDSTYLAALALDGNSILPQSLFRRGGVNAEALVDAQTGVPGQVQGENVIPVIHGISLHEQLVELNIAPGTIRSAKAAPLQFHSQLIVGWKLILGCAHLIVEEPDRRKIRLDGAGGLAVLLHPEGVSGEMLAADILQFLQTILIRQIGAKPFDSFVIPFLGAEDALPVVSGQLIQLTHEGFVDADVFNFLCHI